MLHIQSGIGCDHSVFNLLIFKRRIIALQCRVGLFHTSAVGVPGSPPSWAPLPPSHLQVVTEPPSGFPESHSRFALAVCFIHGGVCAPTLLSPFVPPSPSHLWVCKSVLSVCVSMTFLIFQRLHTPGTHAAVHRACALHPISLPPGEAVRTGREREQ